jgi:hypothetical protein
MTDTESQEIRTIPLDEIVPGAVVRFTILENTQYLSVRDLIMHVCNKDNNDAGQILRRLKAEMLSELQTFCREFKFPGPGQTPQPVITFPGAIKLAMFLPGESAKKNRSLMTNILVRYFAGDPTLIREIEANAASDDPVASMARAVLPAVANDQVGLNLKRKREELEFVMSGIEFYASIGANNALDERGVVVFKDAILGLHTRDLLEIENIRIQQTKEKLQMEREHAKEKLLMEREHANGMFDIENKKRIAENAHSREALEIEQQRQLVEKQKQADAREHAKEMMTAEQENLKNTLLIENERRVMEQEHTQKMLEIAKQEKSPEKEETEQWIPNEICEIDRSNLTLGRKYVASFLNDKMRQPRTVDLNFSALKYHLKRYHRNIQIIKRNSRIFFQNSDLPEIKQILLKMLAVRNS